MRTHVDEGATLLHILHDFPVMTVVSDEKMLQTNERAQMPQIRIDVEHNYPPI